MYVLLIDVLHDLVLQNPVLRLFSVVGLGYLLGRLRVLGASLGIAAVLFVGLAIGAWDAKGFEVPPLLSTVGLTLFVYTIGLASGPAVFRSLRSKKGLRLTGVTVAAVCAAALATLLRALSLRLPGAQAAGLFAGALTNTPTLAAQLEYQERRAASDQVIDRDGPTVGYSLGYPLGVLGVFAVMAALTRFKGVDLKTEMARYDQESGISRAGVVSRNYRVTRLKPNGNQIEAEWLRQQTGLVVARRLHSGHVDVVEGDDVLALGDIILAVGTCEMHQKAEELLGESSPQHLEQNPEVTYRRFFVSNPKIVEKPLSQVHIQALHATVTRIRRGDVEMPASPGLILEKGDVVRVVTHPDNVEKLARYFGDSLNEVADTDFLSISFGMVLGVLLGTLPIPLGTPPHPTLGVAGGTLCVALVLGHLGRTGNIVWTISREANLALRQFGLLLFLACVGLKAGGQFKSALAQSGLYFISAGLLITWTSAITSALLLRVFLKENLVTTLGVIAGTHTQPACLPFAQNLMTDGPESGEGVSVNYAAVFPVAMVSKILLGTALLKLLS